jgi:nicotinate-nucleotide adenylyltransferase
VKVGVLGGTFDPIHCGHLYVARRSLEILGLDRLYLMIARKPPHKGKSGISSGFHRYTMAEMAVLDDPSIFVSPLELLREGPSYTIDTLCQMRGQFPQAEFCFIAGSDSLKEIHLWKDYGKLLAEFCMVFIQRPGSEVRIDELTLKEPLKSRLHQTLTNDIDSISPGRSYLIQINAPPISSTELRGRFAQGSIPSAGEIPPIVLQFIQKHRLYDRD